MTRPFGNDAFERELAAVLDERAEEVASHARTASEIAAELAPRLLHSGSRDRVVVRVLAIAAAVALLLLGAILFGARPSRPALPLLLAVELPLQGEPGAPPIIDAVRLALRDAAPRPDITIDLPEEAVFDDAVEGSLDLDRAAANIRRIAADPRYVAVIGPFNSMAAAATIPIANEAGLLQCSPSNTAPGLTTGSEAASVRPRPERASYVRVAASDEAAATAAARFIRTVLDRKTVFVVTPSEPFAGGRSETFVRAFEDAGGTVVGRGAVGDGGNVAGVVAASIRASGAAAVFFDGPAADGAAVLRDLDATGAETPFVGLDIVLDGAASSTGSFLDVAGPVANGYGVFPAGIDPMLGPQVAAAYARAYGEPASNFVLSGHACATVVLDAIARIDGSELLTAADWREAIRAEVTAPGRDDPTAVGPIRFDANGDAQPTRLSIYRSDPVAREWVFTQLLELGPAD